MQEVVVLIPIYKEKLLDVEKISLRQVKNILRKYKIKFFAPQRLKNFLSHMKFETVYFPDEFFIDPSSYSRLLIRPDFYEHFSEYNYMLIYQLDAFVFYDKLQYFCNLGYDYIGAPWPRWLAPNYYGIHNLVGNGGFSLRHIHNTIQVLQSQYNIVKQTISTYPDSFAEDALFSYLGACSHFQFRTAPWSIAKQFSLEYDFQRSFSKFPNTLPFGCHGWYKLYFVFWKPWIEKFGHIIHEDSFTSKSDSVPDIIRSYIERYKTRMLDRIIQAGPSERNKTIGKYILIRMQAESVSIWGLGDVGRKMIKILHSLQIPIKYLYDSKILTYQGKTVNDWKGMKEEAGNKIIIASITYADEMKRIAFEHFHKMDNVVLWEEITAMICERHWQNCFPKKSSHRF